MRVARAFVVVASILVSALPVAAAWENTVAIYALGASISGDASYRDVTTEVNVPLDDIIEDLEFALMGAYRGQADKWAVMVDTQFFSLGQSTSQADAQLDMLLFEVDGAYRLSERFDVYLGARYLGTDSQVDFTDLLVTDVEGDEDIVDPIVGFAARLPLGGKFHFHARGDVGGFGVGSDLTWQGQASFGYKPSKLISIWLGYRALGYDLDLEKRAGALGLDIVLHGPQLAVGFQF